MLGIKPGMTAESDMPTARAAAATVPNDLEAYWLPFTPNRAFKQAPRLIARAKDMHYFTPEGRAVLDGTAGLWCSNAGHCRDPIVAAIQRQAGELDYSPAFQFAHAKAFELASRIAALAPADLNRVFFCNSGSEAVDTALKIALAYHNVRGEGARTRLIGRERGYHGTGFGGISVGGIVTNRRMFGTLLTGVDHLPATYSREHQAFSKGEPDWGAHLADELERIVALHDASTIAAVIVEPMAGSTGVLPPPKGYLQKLRTICDRHGILLIFDEVITGFGRLGYAFAAERYGVTPDMIVFAKGVTSGAVPMAGVIARDRVYTAFMRGPEHVIELFHGYTYSAHPLACAAGLAALDLYRDERLFERAKALEQKWADAAMALQGLPGVLDIRTVGLTAGIDLAARAGAPGLRAYEAMKHAFRRRRSDDPRHWGHHRIVAAADRERGADRRNFRQGGAGDQSRRLADDPPSPAYRRMRRGSAAEFDADPPATDRAGGVNGEGSRITRIAWRYGNDRLYRAGGWYIDPRLRGRAGNGGNDDKARYSREKRENGSRRSAHGGLRVSAAAAVKSPSQRGPCHRRGASAGQMACLLWHSARRQPTALAALWDRFASTPRLRPFFANRQD